MDPQQINTKKECAQEVKSITSEFFKWFLPLKDKVDVETYHKIIGFVDNLKGDSLASIYGARTKINTARDKVELVDTLIKKIRAMLEKDLKDLD